jgi:hypothetical protein
VIELNRFWHAAVLFYYWCKRAAPVVSWRKTKKMKKFLKWTGIVLLVVIVGFYVYVSVNQHRRFDAPFPKIQATSDSAIIAKGKALVFGPAHCANCHAPEAEQQRVSRGEIVALSGGSVFNLPVGKIYSKNITPHSTG